MSETAAVTDDALSTEPCYCCGGTRGVPTGRWWLLPILSNHVQCLDCGKTYNARTGDSNAPAFVLYAVCAIGGVLGGLLTAALLHP